MQPLVMTPAPGERLQRFVGDHIRFTLHFEGEALRPGWKAFLRTNLGRGALLRREILDAHFRKLPLAGASWRDVPMHDRKAHWELELSLSEVGYFKAKAYAVDEQGRQHWPSGSDFGLSVHPDMARTGNIFYCAFPRLFGKTRFEKNTRREEIEKTFAPFDAEGFAIIPPSGKLRDLAAQIPHIVDRLGCRIVHLLPINPTPTVFARYGRYGSPYAVQDLAAIDPALVEFDRRTTGIEQFEELAFSVHRAGARLFLDVVINHTGWGSTLQENHPEWYLRDAAGNFVSPGAWGVTWEDLAELNHQFPALWENLAEVFVTWCRRGVDGFRCDAGYKVPAAAWQYIIARVQEHFPDTIFFLEGLGGAWEATETLLTDGGMQWAYSELFQNYSPQEISHYLDHSIRQSHRVGALIHYSETHDNERLAARGKTWSLLRNGLCALASVQGGFGFTCGVEWLAPEKIRVHGCTGLAWDNAENMVEPLQRLNRLLQNHPCFFDGASLRRLSPADSPVLALERISQDGLDRVVVLVNTSHEKENAFEIESAGWKKLQSPSLDLLTGKQVRAASTADGVSLGLKPGQSLCLTADPEPKGLAGEAYRSARARSAWGLKALRAQFPAADVAPFQWPRLAEFVDRDPRAFLGALAHIEPESLGGDFLGDLEQLGAGSVYLPVTTWRDSDRSRQFCIPPGHWLLVQEASPFRVHLEREDGIALPRQESVLTSLGYIAAFPPQAQSGRAMLRLEIYRERETRVSANVLFLPSEPALDFPGLKRAHSLEDLESKRPQQSGTSDSFVVPRAEQGVLLTNGRGAMARLSVHLGHIRSKYDCFLGANLHPEVPVDRHIFIKRMRAWLNADGFITPLNGDNLVHFEAGPPAFWRFVASAGDGRSVEIHLTIDMLEGYNATVARFTRPYHSPVTGADLPDECAVSLTVRFDIEDRNFHTETKHNSGSDHHFSFHCHRLEHHSGFEFTPAPDRRFSVTSTRGKYNPEPEWVHNIHHPVEQSRGQEASGDAYSPGWFDVPLGKGDEVQFVGSAEDAAFAPEVLRNFEIRREEWRDQIAERAAARDNFTERLALSAAAFLARRSSRRTVVAGYPWFLDWGRDSLICARGLLAAGMSDEVRALLMVFGKFERDGTLPNTIHGEDASNRDTVDAPLWYGIVCEELAQLEGSPLYEVPVDRSGRRILDVLHSIARSYLQGTPNGVRVDRESGLVWSPSHFTWMDTNYPASTPREGYAIEIQALWIRLLRQLDRLQAPCPQGRWKDLAERATQSLQEMFWIDGKGYPADLLIAPAGRSARDATKDTALRSNFLIPVGFEFFEPAQARSSVQAAADWLVIPGGLRSLAPRPVDPPLEVRALDGRLLNDPAQPYIGRYEGDEDTRRKPAYHNGTAWTWTFPHFCESLASAWEWHPSAVAAAKAYLGSVEHLMSESCLGHVPEILDGDYPHRQRGCDAQAWGATEALRVWKKLNSREG